MFPHQLEELTVIYHSFIGLNFLVYKKLDTFCVSDGSQDSSQPEGLVWKQLKRIVGHDAPPSIMLVDLKDSIAAKFLPPVIQEFRYNKKDYSVFVAHLRI
jgi:hypothetical protein